MTAFKTQPLINPELVILVNEDDQEIGTCEKLAAHRQGLLHRAFSVFVFRHEAQGLELLLQQRAPHKYHSAGLWTNACCSHPRAGETTMDGAQRRLQEEMGFSVPLMLAGTFIYKAELDNGLIEHEYDHVYYGFMDENSDINHNPQEVQAYSWQKVVDLKNELNQNPHKYTAWFQQAFEVALRHLNVTADYNNKL